MDAENTSPKKPCWEQIPAGIKILISMFLMIWLGALGLDRALQAGVTWKNLAHWQNPRSTNDTISVAAEGKVTAIPDVGLISLSVESRNKTVAEVQTDNTKKMNQVVDYLKNLKIEDKDISTTQYNLYPIYSYEQRTGKQNLDGYQLTQTVQVKIRDLDKAGEVLSGSIERGANQVGQLTFSIDDPEKLQQEARVKAIAKARAKAETLARAAGVDLGKVRSFSENVNNPAPYPMYYARDMAVGMESKAVAPQIEAGSQDVTVNVTLSYEIE